MITTNCDPALDFLISLNCPEHRETLIKWIEQENYHVQGILDGIKNNYNTLMSKSEEYDLAYKKASSLIASKSVAA